MRRKLLLADDSITVQRVIELTFADEDLDVSTVGDGGQAIALIERDRPDIVFADLTMPVRDGYGVAEHVKRTPALAAQTRVVLLTGAFEPVDQERAGLLGVDGVLAKPFEPRVAVALVRELLTKPPLAAKGRDERTAAAGYPFDPGAGAPRSTPAELDDYFQRLDEALASAGLVASSAVRDMLAESKAGRDGAAARDEKGRGANGGGDARGATSGSPAAEAGAIKAAPGSGGAAPGVAEALAGLAEAVKEKKTQMSAATPSVPAGGAGPASGTLVDAFSALLAEEQGEATPADGGATEGGAIEGSAGASASASGAGLVPVVGAAGSAAGAATAWASRVHEAGSGSGAEGLAGVAIGDGASAGDGPGNDVASAAGFDAAAGADGGGSGSATLGDAAISTNSTGAAATATPGAPVQLATVGGLPIAGGVTAASVAAALQMTDEFIDAVARRMVEQLGDRIVRDVVTTQVLDIAERLVREEIERLKAAADRS